MHAMKKSIYITLVTFAAITGYAQNLQQDIIKTDNERFADAASDFLVLITKEPAKGENYFYLGENYFKRGALDKFQNGELDSANIYYAKGVELNATNPLNYVGLGKILLAKNNVNEAKTQFFKAASIAQNKNAEVMRRTADAWISTDNKNPDEAIIQLNNAIKIDPKNAENYILLGDTQLEKNPADGSGPIKSYQMATSLDPKSARGILREGKLYQRGRNYQLALDKYKAALAIDPTFAPAYREIAELYFLVAQPAKSIENWKKYLELNNSDYARYRFMSALFKNKQYTEAAAEYENLKKSKYKNVYLDRLAAYSYYEMGDKTDKEAYNKGINAINDFFNVAGPNFKYLGTDYKYKGLLTMKTGKDSLGIIELEKAILLDPTLAGDIYSEIASTSYKNKKYDKAILYYEKKYALDPKSLNNNDWFGLGRAYYNTAQPKQIEVNSIRDGLAKKKQNTETAEIKKKETEVAELFIKADTAFSRLTQVSPVWPTGYIYRGRTNFSIATLDPKNDKDPAKTIHKDLAKSFYEKALSLIKPEERATTGKNNVIEANEYLGYYYVDKKDNEKAKEYWNVVKELDPENARAKAFFAPPKPSGVPKPGGK
jgi:tetratricopeptide (TPR) repeat protein